MRAVTSATAAFAIGVERKELDNLLSRVSTSELPRGRQGVERRIPVSLLPRLFLSHELSARLEIPLGAAFKLAERLVDGAAMAGHYVMLEADLARITTEIDANLEAAIESVVRRRRGRPRKSTG